MTTWLKENQKILYVNGCFTDTTVEWAALDQAARELGLSPVPAEIKSPDELETACANINKERGRGPFCDPYSPHLQPRQADRRSRARSPSPFVSRLQGGGHR